MTLLVFGKTGQLATELQRRAGDAVFLGRGDADLAEPERCAAAIREARPSAVINAAAWTAVDAAEDESDAAEMANAAAPGAMARACAELGIPLVHVSTDYVFDGSGDAPRRPDEATRPLGVYGVTKRDGELKVAAAGGVHAILRTSWVFSAHGRNFVKTMRGLGGTKDHLTIVSDQVGGPTPAAALAGACLTIADALCADPAKSGIYHYSGTPDVSWADFAREIFRQSGQDVTVADIMTADYPTRAPRPLNSRLDCGTTEAVFGIKRPDWRAALGDVLTELAAGDR